MKLFYREYGEGFPIVILHGLYGSSDNWVFIANALSDTYRIILPDMRNHGRSPHNPVHSYAEMSNDLFELINRLNISKFVLAGHSMGGKTALFFARQWPEILSGLVIIDISPFGAGTDFNVFDSFHGQILKRMNETDLSRFENREEANDIFSDITTSVKISNFLLKNMQRNDAGNFEWKLSPGNLYKNLQNIFDGFEKPGPGIAEPVIGFPVYFLRAMKSDYISESDYEPIQILFPAAEIIEIPDSSHWVHTEKPEIIIKLLRDNFPP